MLRQIIFLLSAAKICCASSSSSSWEQIPYVERFDTYQTTMAGGAGGPPSRRDYLRLSREQRETNKMFANMAHCDVLRLFDIREPIFEMPVMEPIMYGIDLPSALYKEVGTLQIYSASSSSSAVHTLEEFVTSREILRKYMLDPKTEVTFSTIGQPETKILAPRVWLNNIALRIINEYESVCLSGKSVSSGEDRFCKISFDPFLILIISKEFYDTESYNQFNVDKYKTSLESFKDKLKELKMREDFNIQLNILLKPSKSEGLFLKDIYTPNTPEQTEELSTQIKYFTTP